MVRGRVLGGDSHPLTEVIARRCLRCLSHLLCTPTRHLPFCVLVAHAGQGWKKQCGGQAMTCRGGMKKLVLALPPVGAPRLRNWGQRDEDFC